MGRPRTVLKPFIDLAAQGAACAYEARQRLEERKATGPPCSGADTAPPRTRPPQPRPLPARNAARSLLLRLVGLPWAKGGRDIPELAGRCDWDYFLSLGARHGVAPVLHARLASGAFEGVVPERIRNALATYHATTLARNVILLSETESFCDRLNRHGIQVMLLKGIALAQGVYPHPALRPMTDVDILVRKGDLPAVRRILESDCGYRDAGIESPAAEAVYGRTTLVKPGAPAHLGRMLLEVHWDIAPLEYEWKGRRSPTAEFWSGAQEAHLGESLALVPEDADHLCYVAMHNCVHCFDRLMGLMDVAYLLPRSSQHGAWEGLVRRARRYGCRLDLFLNIALAHGLFGTPVPPEALRELAPAEWHARLQARLFTPEAIFDEKFSTLRRYLTRMLSVDRFGDALRFIVWGLFPSRAWRAHQAELRRIHGATDKKLTHLLLLAQHAGKAVTGPLRRLWDHLRR